jgi:hypothetical protein
MALTTTDLAIRMNYIANYTIHSTLITLHIYIFTDMHGEFQIRRYLIK